MSSNFSFKGAWLRNPFSAVPVAGRAQVLQEMLLVLRLDKEGCIYRARAWGRVGSLLSSLHPSLCLGCSLPGELIQHPPSSALARLRYKRLISCDCAHLPRVFQVTRYLWAMGWGAQRCALHGREDSRDPGVCSSRGHLG